VITSVDRMRFERWRIYHLDRNRKEDHSQS
jgi:hypothetical protein